MKYDSKEKRLARERQGKTGEPLTVARAHVLAKLEAFDPDWRHGVVRGAIMPRPFATSEAWEQAANKGTTDRPKVASLQPRSLPALELGVEQLRAAEELLRPFALASGVRTVEDAWRFLGVHLDADQRDVALAKDLLRKAGVGECGRLVPNFRGDLGVFTYDPASGELDSKPWVLRCSRCAKDVGTINVADALEEETIERAERTMVSAKRRHARRFPGCAKGKVVVTREVPRSPCSPGKRGATPEPQRP